LAFSDKGRFRVNAYTQKNSLAAAFRLIPLTIPAIEALGLPPILHSFTNLRQGLVLVTGPTGHGKSTTLASMIEEINQTRDTHIVTIEDPVEFIFKPAKSIISQSEMRSDTHSWEIALRSTLREDPDVVFIGEMRDYETIAAALTVAETGHLVFATLHTNSAAQSIDRIVDVFPDEQQQQIRLQLSNVLEAVFSQRLIPGTTKGRVVAYEVMLGTTAIKTSIREGKTHQIESVLETSQEAGMSTLEKSLATLVRNGDVTLETAQSWSLRPEELTRLVRGV
jgi:twitching motility protein PilT